MHVHSYHCVEQACPVDLPAGEMIRVALSPAVTRASPPRYHAPFDDTFSLCIAPADQADANNIL